MVESGPKCMERGGFPSFLHRAPYLCKAMHQNLQNHMQSDANLCNREDEYLGAIAPQWQPCMEEPMPGTDAAPRHGAALFQFSILRKSCVCIPCPPLRWHFLGCLGGHRADRCYSGRRVVTVYPGWLRRAWQACGWHVPTVSL